MMANFKIVNSWLCFVSMTMDTVISMSVVTNKYTVFPLSEATACNNGSTVVWIVEFQPFSKVDGSIAYWWNYLIGYLQLENQVSQNDKNISCNPLFSVLLQECLTRWFDPIWLDKINHVQSSPQGKEKRREGRNYYICLPNTFLHMKASLFSEAERTSEKMRSVCLEWRQPQQRTL